MAQVVGPCEGLAVGQQVDVAFSLKRLFVGQGVVVVVGVVDAFQSVGVVTDVVPLSSPPNPPLFGVQTRVHHRLHPFVVHRIGFVHVLDVELVRHMAFFRDPGLVRPQTILEQCSFPEGLENKYFKTGISKQVFPGIVLVMSGQPSKKMKKEKQHACFTCHVQHYTSMYV